MMSCNLQSIGVNLSNHMRNSILILIGNNTPYGSTKRCKKEGNKTSPMPIDTEIIKGFLTDIYSKSGLTKKEPFKRTPT